MWGEATLSFIFLLPFQEFDSLRKEIDPLRVDPFMEPICHRRKQTGFCVSFTKMAENRPVYEYSLKSPYILVWIAFQSDNMGSIKVSSMGSSIEESKTTYSEQIKWENEFPTYETEFVLFLAVLEISVLCMGWDSSHETLKVASVVYKQHLRAVTKNS